MRLTERDREAIGAMLCVGIRGATLGDGKLDDELRAIRAAHVGAVVLFDRDLATGGARNIIDADQVRALVEQIHAAGAMVAIDQEGGRVARLRVERGFDEGVSAEAFGRLEEQEQWRIAARQARQLAASGIDLNFAPCVDLAAAGVIGDRSFGDDPEVVERCARIVIEAHRSAGVATCLKHFPGHGPGDSHDGLVAADARAMNLYARLDAPCVMVGHLMSAFDETLPASLSSSSIENLRKRGFQGVVATDSLDMGALATFGDEATVMAVMAGADLLVNGFNSANGLEGSPQAMAASIERAVVDGVIEMERVCNSARRVRVLREI